VDPLTTLTYQAHRLKSLQSTREDLVKRCDGYKAAKDGADRRLALIDLSKDFYRKALDLIYAESIGELEKLLDTALQFVFFDKQYKIKVVLDEKYGKSLEFLVVDHAETPPMELSLFDGVGNGVRTVVSFVLHVFYLINVGAAPVLLLDECYSAISEFYVDRFFTFVKGLAKTRNLHVVMITHDNRFTVHADKVYNISNGHVLSQ